MINMKKLMDGLETCSLDDGECSDCPYYTNEMCSGQMARDVLALPNEMKEQKKEWLMRIADEQVANAPDVFYPEDENTRRMGVYQGLEIAYKILTGIDQKAEIEAVMQERSNT